MLDECNFTFFACVWQSISGRAQWIIHNVTNNSSHCEKNALKAAISLMVSCGDTARNELDKHGNIDEDLWLSVDNPERNGDLLLGDNFYGP